MRIGIPLANGRLTEHFGHCERFALLDVDASRKRILKREDIDAPPHQPGLLPPWLVEWGVTLVIAGGIGRRAQDLLEERGVQVLAGVSGGLPERVVREYLAGTLRAGENACDH